VIDHLAVLERETRALIAAARSGPLDTPVPACPGWDMGRLCGHIGRVQRWTTEVARTREPVDTRELPKPEPGQEADYLAEALDPLLTALRALPADEPCWNFTGRTLVGGFWHRRQAHEAVVHRWDAQSAIGAADPIDPAVASDGIDEALLTLASGRLPEGTRLDGSVHFHCTDVDGEWMIADATDGEEGVVFTREHGKGSVALRGPASSLLLVVWRRIPPTADGLETFGDPAVLDRWLSLGVPG
jgi:uncharacterized protein (TIGR03083 family)